MLIECCNKCGSITLFDEDAQNYGDKHAKPYGFDYCVTKEGTKNRPYILWALIERTSTKSDSKEEKLNNVTVF